jgi:DNA polymerase-1
MTEMYGGIHFADGPDPDNITRMDHGALPMIRDFHRHGIRLDVPFLHSLNTKIQTIQSEIELETSIHIGDYQYRNPTKGSLEPFKIGSRDHLAQLLFEHLQIQGKSPIPKTPSGKRFEVSEEIMEPFKDRHPIVSGLIEWHKVEKLRNTYTDTLPLLVDSESRVHTQFNATVAATGRLSSSNPNLQNIPIRTFLGNEIRKAFTAPPGWDLVSADYSQVEMVWAAHRSQDPTMLEVFRKGQDIHDRTTCNVFGYDYDEIQTLKKLVKSGNATPEQDAKFKDYTKFKRIPCKTVGFGVLYGQTAEGLQKSIAADGVIWTVEQCEDLITNKFFGVYPGLKEMLERDHRFVRRYAMICCDFGRVRLVPEAKSQIKRIMNEGTRKAGNHPEQASAQGSIKVAMARILALCRKLGEHVVKPLLQIHDELIFQVVKNFSIEFAELVRLEMEAATPLSIPVRSSSDIAERWGDFK